MPLIRSCSHVAMTPVISLRSTRKSTAAPTRNSEWSASRWIDRYSPDNTQLLDFEPLPRTLLLDLMPEDYCFPTMNHLHHIHEGRTPRCSCRYPESCYQETSQTDAHQITTRVSVLANCGLRNRRLCHICCIHMHSHECGRPSFNGIRHGISSN